MATIKPFSHKKKTFIFCSHFIGILKNDDTDIIIVQKYIYAHFRIEIYK